MIRRAAGSILVASGIATIVVLRIHTVDMTEGQALAEHWQLWLLACVSMVSGVHLVR